MALSLETFTCAKILLHSFHVLCARPLVVDIARKGYLLSWLRLQTPVEVWLAEVQKHLWRLLRIFLRSRDHALLKLLRNWRRELHRGIRRNVTPTLSPAVPGNGACVGAWHVLSILQVFLLQRNSAWHRHVVREVCVTALVLDNSKLDLKLLESDPRRPASTVHFCALHLDLARNRFREAVAFVYGDPAEASHRIEELQRAGVTTVLRTDERLFLGVHGILDIDLGSTGHSHCLGLNRSDLLPALPLV
mmetsp:Transcript_21547/g.40549  ORF Transcript_21547/g.40549 Transcript_21547/m.40549 type:complete len:248 (+) Transcript_21547:108-851(+)